MRRLARTELLAILMTGAAAQAAEVSFTAEIVPLLNARCVSCHLTGDELGGLALHPKAAYGNLVGVPSRQSPLKRVEPGHPEASYLYLKLTDAHLDAGGEGEPMPLGAWPLDEDQLELVRRWIADGAKPE
jgi:hypothetical protein